MRGARHTTIAAAAVALSLTACSGEAVAERFAEEAMERGSGGDIDIDTESGTMTAETDEGTTTIGGAGELPGGFPDELPLPEGDHDVVSSYSETTDDEERLIVVLMTSGTVDEVVDGFTDRLDAGGWDVGDSNRTEMGELVSSSLQATGHGRGVHLTVTRDEDDTVMVSYVIGPEES